MKHNQEQSLTVDRTVRAAAAFLTLLAFTACGQSTPEEELAAAGEALNEATTELSDIDATIEQTENLLDSLRAERREQRDRVLTFEQRVEARATDVAIFRAVQAALLDDDRLQSAAVAADVEDAVVTLSGVVATREQSARATQLAKQIAGVSRVISRIRINNPEAGGDGA